MLREMIDAWKRDDKLLSVRMAQDATFGLGLYVTWDGYFCVASYRDGQWSCDLDVCWTSVTLQEALDSDAWRLAL